MLDAGAPSEAELAEALLPFLGPDAHPLGELIAALEGRGWVARDDEQRFILSASGRAALQALAADVAVMRSQLIEGVTESEYQRTIEVLTRMATNLEEATPGSHSNTRIQEPGRQGGERRSPTIDDSSADR